MTRTVWLTDVHFEFLDGYGIAAFLASVRECQPDVILVGGDTGQARTVLGFLRTIQSQLHVPVYFVLGNHDFYGGSIHEVRGQIQDAVAESRRLHWLEESGIVELGPRTALVGADGWADARCGDYDRSTVVLNDYLAIREFIALDRVARRETMQALADSAADRIRSILPTAADSYPEIIFLTHSPPFRDACWHEGAISNDDYLPHFSSKVMGEVLIDTMGRHPDTHLTVLCGHTHSSGRAEILPNLVALTGQAQYGAPEVQQVFELG